MVRKTQSVLESVIAYGVAILLLATAIGIWAWGNSHIPIREITYEATRQKVGQPNRKVNSDGANRGNKFLGWPTYRAYPCS